LTDSDAARIPPQAICVNVVFNSRLTKTVHKMSDRKK
jgi:hypothetical protein